MAAGRPTKYTKTLSDKICARLAAGESMRSVSRDPKMPVMTTLFRWLRENEEFKQHYERAKEESADAFVEEINDIADNQVTTYENEYGRKVTDSGSVQHARLRIDSRKWTASKLKPKKYGEKLDMTSGGEKMQPLMVEVIRNKGDENADS